jgi:hypothetical protein
MGCGKKDDVFESHRGCICEVVRAVKDIQDAAVEEDCECPRNCFLEPLGSLVSPVVTNVNTRVIVLKTADGSPFHAFFRDQVNATTLCGVSIFFRVEEIFDNCCATLRVLRPAGTPVTDCDEACEQFCASNLSEFFATNDCVTVDLNCFCAIQCIADVFVDLCE